MVYSSAVVLTLWLVWISIPVVLGLASLLIYFWTRKRCEPKWADWFQKLKYDGYDKAVWQPSDKVVTYFFFDLFAIGVAAGLFSCAVPFLTGIHYLIALLVLCAIILPRYGMDIVNALKYNHKTKDSDRLVKLEQEVD